MAAKKKTTKKAVKKKTQKKASQTVVKKSKPKAKAKATPAKGTAKKRSARSKKAAAETPGPQARSTRYRRPEPERTQPLRSGAASGFDPSPGYTDGYTPSAHPFQRASEALANDLGSTVGKAVDLGYRVIEDQIRQGRDVAAQLGHGHYDGAPWQGQSSGLRGVTVTTMLASLWLDLLGNLVNGIQEMGVDAMGGGFSLESGPMPWQPAGGTRRTSPPAAEAICSVAVEVDSKRPVEVEIDLGRIRAEQRVAAHLVNAGDPDAPPLKEVIFDIVEGKEGSGPRPRVRVRVDDELSAGLYTGVAIDCDSGRHIGSLTIRVAG